MGVKQKVQEDKSVKNLLCLRHLILGCALALPRQDKLSVTKPELPVLGFGSYPGPPEASETVKHTTLMQNFCFNMLFFYSFHDY